MAHSDIHDALPVTPVDPAQYADAARYLEQALKARGNDPHIAYLLGVCCKRLGKTVEARQAFARIDHPDANVWLQRGLLSYQEKEFAQAEEEFARSWEMDPSSYAAGYNLLLARLNLGHTEACATMIARLLPLCPSADEQRFLTLLEALLSADANDAKPAETTRAEVASRNGADQQALLASMNAGEEFRLLQALGGLGQFEPAYALLWRLATLRPHSPAARDAYVEVLLVQAKRLIDQGQWEDARELLAPFGRQVKDKEGAAPQTAVALLNMLGVCACLLQDYDQAVWYFEAALKKSEDDAWLQQNLALAHEWRGRLDYAERHWNLFFDLLDRRTPAPKLPDYLAALRFECVNRLAEVYSKKEKWNSAVSYLEKAHRLRPSDADVLERLYHLYSQLKRPDEARRALRRLRDVRPNDPQFDLYELDLRDVKSLDDIERMLADIRKVLNRHPGDLRVEERAVGMVGNVIPLMSRTCDRLTDQLNKIVDQMRRLPSYQVNWPAVREVMRDLEDEFLKLRRITNKCLQLVANEEHRRTIRELAEHIDRKIDLCHNMGG